MFPGRKMKQNPVCRTGFLQIHMPPVIFRRLRQRRFQFDPAVRGRAEKTVVQVPVFFKFKGTAVGQNFHLHAEGVNRKGHVDHAVFKVEGFAPFALFGIFRFDQRAFYFEKKR